MAQIVTSLNGGNSLSPPFVIFMKRQALLARFRSAQIRGFKSRTRNTRSRGNGTAIRVTGISQESVVAGARNARFWRLIERAIPKLAA
jgi:hypothetical protein